MKRWKYKSNIFFTSGYIIYDKKKDPGLPAFSLDYGSNRPLEEDCVRNIDRGAQGQHC